MSERVTVILSTYNGAAYIDEAVESVLGQTFRDLVFRIIDDGSSDSTWSRLEAIAKRDHRLVLERNTQNRGTGFSYSRLLRSAKGEFIAQIGQDDRWQPNHLETLVSCLESDAGAIAAFGSVQIIDSKGRSRADISSPFQHAWAQTLSSHGLVLALLKKNFICGGASLFRRAGLAEWQSLGENDQLQDWDTWLRLALKGRFRWLPEHLHNYRIHGENLSLNGVSPTLMALDTAHTRRHALARPEFWRVIRLQADPNEAFQSAMETLLDSIRADRPDDWDSLLFALRINEAELWDLERYRPWLGLLFWTRGALGKAQRVLEAGAPLLSLPAGTQRVFAWRAYIFWTPSDIQLSSFEWCVTRRIGPLTFVKAWLYAPQLSRRLGWWLPRFGTARVGTRRVEQLIERSLALEELGLGAVTRLALGKVLNTVMVRTNRWKASKAPHAQGNAPK